MVAYTDSRASRITFFLTPSLFSLACDPTFVIFEHPMFQLACAPANNDPPFVNKPELDP